MRRFLPLGLVILSFACSSQPSGGAPSAPTQPEASPVESGTGRDGGSEASVPVGDAGTGGLNVPGDGAVATLPPPTVPDYLIVAADDLAASAGRYKTFRESSGHMVSLKLASELAGASTDRTAINVKIREYVRGMYEARDERRPLFLLIIGDDVSATIDPKKYVPAARYTDSFSDYTPGFKNTTTVTDNYYADMDGDHIPDLAVGRIPASKDEEVDLVRAKAEKHEATYEVGEHNRRINIFSSTGDFGDALDSVLESLAFQIVEDVSYDYDISMTYAKQSSPYVYVPGSFSNKVYERMNEGALMVSYVGHGYRSGFADLEWSGKKYPILDTGKLESFAVQHRSPILTFIACATGDFDSGNSVSERILRQANAPAIVLSSTEVSHPVPNAIFVREIGAELTLAQPRTIGELFVSAKGRLVNNNDDLRQRLGGWIDAFLKAGELDALKRLHLHMYELFGDPALKLRFPARGSVTVVPRALPAESVAVAVSLPGVADGELTVTLESKRSDILGTIAKVPSDADSSRDGVIDQNYRTANNKVVLKQRVSHKGGQATLNLVVPADLKYGNYVVKVFGDDGQKDAIASAAIVIAPAD